MVIMGCLGGKQIIPIWTIEFKMAAVSPKKVRYKYIWLSTKCEVKMTGYWPSSFFACLWTETKLRSINVQKRTKPIPCHLDRASLVNNGIIIWLSGNFSGGIQRVIPRGQESSILPPCVANHSARFGLSCPLTELAI